MYAGTRPRLYKSENGGDSWRKLGLSRRPREDELRLPGDPDGRRPGNPRELYAGLEVDGVMRSRDGGETWET